MENLVRREKYMAMLRAGRGLMDIVKVVTGMRRAGKSTLLDMYSDELIADGVEPEDIIRINFETFEYRDIEDREDLDRILEEVREHLGDRVVRTLGYRTSVPEDD